MTAALEAARPGHTLPPGKTRYPSYRRLGGPQGRSGRAENLVPTRIRSRIVQPVVSRYTDWDTLPTFYINPLALELDIYSLAHYLFKMWIFYEPRRVTLGNTRNFVEE